MNADKTKLMLFPNATSKSQNIISMVIEKVNFYKISLHSVRFSYF